MTKIIVNATHKGGEGKTTNSIMLAEYIAIVKKLRTLAIDMDAQANLSGRYLKMEYDQAFKEGKIPPIHPDFNPDTDKDWDGRSTIANIFFGQGVVPYSTSIPKLELMPAYSHKLQEAEAVTKSEVVEKVHVRLKEFLSLKAIQDSYDVIVIDTPPSKGPLTIASIKAATHLIIPTQMEQFSIEGVYGMLQLWKQESYSRAAGDKIELVGILPNRMRSINLHKSFLESLKSMRGISNYVIPHMIRELAIYKELLVENANPRVLFDLPAENQARKEYETVCKLITDRVFNHE
jgi:chromosome partitioning protein